jgi:hypothetical protein
MFVVSAAGVTLTTNIYLILAFMVRNVRSDAIQAPEPFAGDRDRVEDAAESFLATL